MSKKLSTEEQVLSEDAVYHFRLACKNPDIFKTRVQAFDGDRLITDNDNLKVRVVEKFTWFEIPIFWEDGGLTQQGYHNLGLYGSYSTGYSKMVYIEKKKQLKIYSSDSNITILIDAK